MQNDLFSSCLHTVKFFTFSVYLLLKQTTESPVKDIWGTFLDYPNKQQFTMLGLSPPSSLLSFHHLLCAVNISKPRIQDPWFPQALLQYAIRLAVLSLDQYGVSVSPKPIMRKLRLNLKLSMTGRISVQPKMSLTSKMSVGFEPEGGLEVGFL